MYEKPKYPRGMRFFPTFVMEDVLVCFVFLIIFFAVVFFFPEWVVSGASEVPADSFNTPEHIKPEWYFLGSYQFLKLVPDELGGILIQAVAGMIVLFLPFIDRGDPKPILRRPVFLLCVLFGVISFIGLTLWGGLS